MNLNKIIAICEELRGLKAREEVLRKKLAEETLSVKAAIPEDLGLLKEKHEQKFTTIPPDIYWGGGNKHQFYQGKTPAWYSNQPTA